MNDAVTYCSGMAKQATLVAATFALACGFAAAPSSAAVVSDDFNSMTNPGWFTVSQAAAPTPTLDFSSGQMAFNSGPLTAVAGQENVLDHAYAVRPFAPVDLANVGDFLEVAFTLSLPTTPGSNVVTDIRGFQFALIGAGGEVLPTSDTTYSGSDLDLGGDSAYNVGARITPTSTQASFPFGNAGGNGGVNSEWYFKDSGGFATTGIGSNSNFANAVEDGAGITFRVTRLADAPVTSGTPPTESVQYQLILDIDNPTLPDISEVGTLYVTRGNRSLGTIFEQFAIGSTDFGDLSVGETGSAAFTIDDFSIAIPEPASLALLGLGGLTLLRRRG